MLSHTGDSKNYEQYRLKNAKVNLLNGRKPKAGKTLASILLASKFIVAWFILHEAKQLHVINFTENNRVWITIFTLLSILFDKGHSSGNSSERISITQNLLDISTNYNMLRYFLQRFFKTKISLTLNRYQTCLLF